MTVERSKSGRAPQQMVAAAFVRGEDSDGGLAWQRACVWLARWLAGNGAAYSHRLTASKSKIYNLGTNPF